MNKQRLDTSELASVCFRVSVFKIINETESQISACGVIIFTRKIGVRFRRRRYRSCLSRPRNTVLASITRLFGKYPMIIILILCFHLYSTQMVSATRILSLNDHIFCFTCPHVLFLFTFGPRLLLKLLFHPSS